MLNDEYDLPGNMEQRVLGHGGASVNVERCTNRVTGQEFAAKRMSVDHILDHPWLIDNEVHGLTWAKQCNILRVPELVNMLRCPQGEGALVLELVCGVSLDESCRLSKAAHDIRSHEQLVKNVTAELLQTMQHLHFIGELCHLDVSGSNVMLRTDDFEPWDQVRLVDFGFCQGCLPDLHSLDVVLQGTTPAFAAPQILRSLQYQYEQEGEGPSWSTAVNGPSADYWGVGIVVYKYLTGHLPFDSRSSQTPCTAPSCVHSSNQPYWEAYERILQLQRKWIEACYLAEETGSPVQHPLLDRVRQCSTNPDQAVLFFHHILNPVPHLRARAMHHPWIAETVDRMFAETGTGYEPVDPSQLEGPEDEFLTMPDKHLQAPRSSRFRSCAALLPRCACFSSPKVQEDDQPLPNPQTQTTGQHGMQTVQDGNQSSLRSKLGKKGCLSRIKAAFSKKTKHGSSLALSGNGVLSLSAMDPALSASQAQKAAHDTTDRIVKQAVQGQAVHSGESILGVAAVNVTAVSGSVLEQLQAAIPAEPPRQPAVNAEPGTDRPKVKHSLLKRLAQTGRTQAKAFVKLVHKGQA